MRHYIAEKYRYHRVDPVRLSKDHRFYKVLEVYRNKCSHRLGKLRRTKAYRDDVQRARRVAGIPPEGYERWEARRKLGPYAKAYYACVRKQKGHCEYATEAGVWAFLIRLTERFAKEHRLGKRWPMPLEMAFEEIVYKKPRHRLIIKGYFEEANNRPLKATVWLEDGVMKAPEAIARMVQRRLRGDDVEVIKPIRIRTFRRKDIGERIFQRLSRTGDWTIHMR